MSASPSGPELAALAAGAGTDHPRKLKSALTKLARPLSAADRIGFFEDACRAFVAAGPSETATELATWSFTQARKVEKDDAGLRDVERLHAVFLEFVPAGVVAPTALRDYVKTLSGHFPPGEAHARFREVICAGFDAGLIPYARLFPDLRKLAVAAGIAKQDEEEFLAARLLRDGLLSGASQTIWTAARPALATVARRDGELLDLLIAAEPDRARHEEEGGAELAEKMRQMWLATLADAGAGARLPADWFATIGRRCAVDVLLTLVDQGGDRLFPDDAGPGGLDPETDPATIPGRRAPWDDVPDAEMRDLLKADVKAGHLYRLDRALTWLFDKGWGFLRRNPGFARELEFTDPVDALLVDLRSGIPEEFGIPVFLPGRVARSVVQHRRYLSVRTRREVEVDDGGGGPWTVRLGRFPEALMPWYDGEVMRVSRVRPGGRWQTFRADGTVDVGGDGEDLALTYEPDACTARPEAPGAGEVTFPGAAAPSQVRLHRGQITVTAPDGSQNTRLDYSPRNPSVPPPAMWGRRSPVDPAGSAALRTLDRDTAERMVLAALPASRGVLRPVRDELVRLLPEITEPSLVAAVAQRMYSAAQCLLNEHWLRTKDGVAPRPPLAPLLEVHPELPLIGLRRLVSLRVLEGHLLATAAEGPDPAEPQLLRDVEHPQGDDFLIEDFGGMARHVIPILWPWQRPHAVWSLDALRAWANSGWGDGSGRYRLLWFAQPSPRPPSKPHIEVWRTQNGSLLSFSGWHRRGFAAVEYSPDGRFVPIGLPQRDLVGEPVPQGWLSQERLLRLEHLLAEKGPPPVHAEAARELAARTGLTTAQAVDLLYGDEDGRLRPRTLPSGEDLGLPAEIADLLEATRGERLDWNFGHAFRPDEGRLGAIRERLMPDDPADLWTTGFDIDRAAAWWQEECRRQGW